MRRREKMEKLESKKQGFSFFVRPGGSGKIRGKQMAEYIGGKVNPQSGYENDVCVYVKNKPSGQIPKKCWVDVVDEMYPIGFIERHPKQVNAIAIAKPQIRYLSDRLKFAEIVYIPEQHCNWERKRRPDRKIKVVGTLGGATSFQWPQEQLVKMFEAIGLEWRFQVQVENRFDVMKFYEEIDIQAVYRPWQKWVPFGNPLKLENAGSFGIPTVAFPEQSYIEEWPESALWGDTVEEIIGKVKNLKDDPGLYKEMSARALARAEDYHIEHISKLYLKLGGVSEMTYPNATPLPEAVKQEKIEVKSEPEGDSFRVYVSAVLRKKSVMIDGEMRQVYGLSSFGVRPREIRKKGMGGEMLKILEKITRDDGRYCIVAFCDDQVFPFYHKCGWYGNGKYNNQVVLTSVPVKSIAVTEVW